MADANVAMLQRETRSSIEVTRNAKGDYQWTIKVYFEDDGGAAEARQRLEIIDSRLRRTFLPASERWAT